MGCNNSKPAYYNSFHGCYISFCGRYISFRGCNNSFCGRYNSFCGCYISFSSCYNSFCSWIVLTCVFSLRQTDAQRSEAWKCGVNATPSLYKYRKNFKLNNCAISDFPDTRHIFKPLLYTVLYFHELKKINATFIHNVWFSVFKCHANLICHAKFGSVFNFSQSFLLRIVFKLLKSENCHWRFSTKFGFSFQLSHKIFRLQFSLIF